MSNKKHQLKETIEACKTKMKFAPDWRVKELKETMAKAEAELRKITQAQ